MQRAILYIDGFNFYYGVTKFWRETTKKAEVAGLGWCDFRALVERHFPPQDAQLEVKYFTAPVNPEHETPSHLKDEYKRYYIWSRAVRTIPGIKVIEGIHQMSGETASGEVWNRDAPRKSRKEKQTDVNLAVEILLDALSTEPPSKVYLLSDDRDLMPVVFALLERLPVRVGAGAPPHLGPAPDGHIPVVVLLPSEARDKNKWEDSYNKTAERLVGCDVVSRKL